MPSRNSSGNTSGNDSGNEDWKSVIEDLQVIVNGRAAIIGEESEIDTNLVEW